MTLVVIERDIPRHMRHREQSMFFLANTPNAEKHTKRREQREDWRLKIDEPFYCIPFNIFFRGTKGSTRDTEHRDHQIPLVPNKDYLLWGEDNTKEKLFEGKDDQSG